MTRLSYFAVRDFHFANIFDLDKNIIAFSILYTFPLNRNEKKDRTPCTMGTIRQNIFGDLIAHLDRAQSKPQGMILMVGEPQRMQTLKRHFPQDTGLFFIEFCDLTPEILHSINPGSVVAPVISAHFDCLDLAALLQDADYKGAFRAITKGLPRPEIVRNEVRSQFPDLDFDMLSPEPVRIQTALH
ncbi:hypothetical protein [Celeribacter sp. PS-C1]|uniref:hypothetical protein n=1 Tax=Celeribacter sp. PS-C1 TaxID=2820813 RepID=UPI001CA5D8AD|nr:hypothetical protein [Celeribacter sp. PS-C1]MBW6417188.1 hypothetical protein [Celeribacter sp. PS-C1]